MLSDRCHLGIELADGVIRLVEINHSGKGNALSLLDEIATDISFESVELNTYIRESTFADGVTELLSTHLGRDHIRARQVAVALSSAQAFIVHLPVDAHLSKSELYEHLRWELSNYYPDESPDTFALATYFMRRLNGSREMLVVAVRREIIDFLKTVFSRCDLPIDIIDIDHFAAEHALRATYADIATMDVALFGLKSHHLDVSVISKGKFLLFRHDRFENGTDAQYFVTRQIATIQEKLSAVALDNVFLYGPEVTSELCVALTEMLNLPVERMNPFRGLTISRELQDNEALTMSFHRFAPSAGLALRTE